MRVPGEIGVDIHTGHLPSAGQTGHTSIPINECILRPDICGHGKCVDTVTSYECHCDPGYRMTSSGICEGWLYVETFRQLAEN